MTQVRATTPVGVERPLRADARRNRESLLRAATEAFAGRGLDVSLEEIARRAGVGIGTLYRHFPTREALVEAVYRHGVETMCDTAAELVRERPPDEALAAWMQEFVRYVAEKRGLASHLKGMIGQDSELFAYSHQRIREAINTVLGPAVQAGLVRSDVAPQDLLRAMSGICMIAEPPVDDEASRLVGLLMDGLRYGASASAPD